MENTYKIENSRLREALLTILLLNYANLSEKSVASKLEVLGAYERLRLANEVDLVSIQKEMKIYSHNHYDSYYSTISSMIKKLYDIGETRYKDKKSLDYDIVEAQLFLLYQLRELYPLAYYEMFSWLGDPVAYKKMVEEYGGQIYIPKMVMHDFSFKNKKK